MELPPDAQVSPMEVCAQPNEADMTVLQRVRRSLTVGACASSAWLDGLFGDQIVRLAAGSTQMLQKLPAAKLRSVRSLDRDKAVRRLVGMLARKGHSSSVASRAKLASTCSVTSS